MMKTPIKVTKKMTAIATLPFIIVFLRAAFDLLSVVQDGAIRKWRAGMRGSKGVSG